MTDLQTMRRVEAARLSAIEWSKDHLMRHETMMKGTHQVAVDNHLVTNALIELLTEDRRVRLWGWPLPIRRPIRMAEVTARVALAKAKFRHELEVAEAREKAEAIAAGTGSAESEAEKAAV